MGYFALAFFGQECERRSCKAHMSLRRLYLGGLPCANMMWFFSMLPIPCCIPIPPWAKSMPRWLDVMAWQPPERLCNAPFGKPGGQWRHWPVTIPYAMGLGSQTDAVSGTRWSTQLLANLLSQSVLMIFLRSYTCSSS